MSFRRYIAATVREALDRVRKELGEDAVILSNKRLGPGRIEVVAAAADSMQALVEQADRPQPAARAAAAPRSQARAEARAEGQSFQDFIRHQQTAPAARARAAAVQERIEPASPREAVAMYHEVAQASVQAAQPQAPGAVPAVFRARDTRPAQAAATVAGSGSAGTWNAPPPPASPEAVRAPQRDPDPRPLPAAAAQPQEAPSAAPEAAPESPVMAELRSLRAALSDRITALESNIAVARPAAAPGASGPVRSAAPTRVMTRLLMSGFSPDLARKVATYTPVDGAPEAIDHWLHEVIAGNLRCAAAGEGLMEGQGAVALVGPTGVGKTTTVAKLAARFAVRHGASQLGLVTLDSYRIGAHEQLRSYGRILGVPMHVAQDGATLRELLASLQGKRLVLVDTCGLSQRDERMEEMLGTLSAARFNGQPIRRVLLLNAASHTETLDEVARAWRAQETAGAVITKLDEAARIGGAVDCLLRHRLMLFGLTNGQRVPEDWHPAGARLIAHVALKPSATPFALGEQEALDWAEQPQSPVHV